MSDILTQYEIAAVAVTADTAPPMPDAPPADAQPEAVERARDEQGRFLPKTDEAAPEGDDDKQRQVPQQALHAERERRKGAESQLRAAQEQLAAIQALRQRVATPQPPVAAPEPNADDPAGVQHLRSRLEALETQTSQASAAQQQSQLDDYEMRTLSATVSTDEATFRQQQPDYDAAVDYLVTARARELQAYGVDAVQMQEIIRQEAADIARTAVQQGRSPAEMAYQVAQFRGYRTAEPAKLAATPATPASSAQATLDAIAKGRQVSKSVGSAGGGAGVDTLNAAAIAAMSEDEFAKLYATPEGRALIDAL